MCLATSVRNRITKSTLSCPMESTVLKRNIFNAMNILLEEGTEERTIKSS